MKISDNAGEALVKKTIRFLSNSPEVLKRVGRRCSNAEDESLDKPRRADIMGGHARQCQVCPRDLCRAVGAGIEAQRKLHNLGMKSEPVMNIEEIFSINAQADQDGGPSQELHDKGEERRNSILQKHWRAPES